ncbi:MAG: hypothetical protein P8J87_05955, partial [Verrucomicrobiales bacterium]|nr:hypothetical protein [Verrucomicrobiales bacterium]
RSNFHHYAFGTDPRAAGNAADPLPSIAADGAPLEFTYRFRDPALDLQYIVEESDGLSAWSEATTELVQTASDGEITTVTVRLPAPVEGVPVRRFVRVAAQGM